MYAVIMAGGRGTRLFSVTKDEIPKPMVQLCGKPVLEYQLECLRDSGISDFYIVTGYLGEAIKDYFDNGSKWNIKIQYIQEETPLGTAGALYYLKEEIKEDFLLLFGDLIFDINIDCFLKFHRQHHAKCTLLVHPNTHPYDSDVVEMDEEKKIIGFLSKKVPRKRWYHNLVNSGIYFLAPDFLEQFTSLEKKDMENDIIVPMILSRDDIYGYYSTEYIRDVGTPERLKDTESDICSGLVAAKRMGKRQKCVFLDRDGTVNRFVGLLKEENDLELEIGAAEAVRLLNASDYLAILVTNQPAVARGICSIEEIGSIHMKLETMLGKEGAYLDDILFCPHHPDRGYPEENVAYKIVCGCRKPKTGMIDACVEKYNIDRGNSWIVGDTTVDIQTGKNAGIKSALVLTGEAGRDRKHDAVPDLVGSNLLEAVKKILQGSGISKADN